MDHHKLVRESLKLLENLFYQIRILRDRWLAEVDRLQNHQFVFVFRALLQLEVRAGQRVDKNSSCIRIELEPIIFQQISENEGQVFVASNVVVDQESQYDDIEAVWADSTCVCAIVVPHAQKRLHDDDYRMETGVIIEPGSDECRRLIAKMKQIRKYLVIHMLHCQVDFDQVRYLCHFLVDVGCIERVKAVLNGKGCFRINISEVSERS